MIDGRVSDAVVTARDSPVTAELEESQMDSDSFGV